MADGQYKKVLQSLTSMGLTLPTTDVLNEMLAKHPPADPPAVPEMPTPPPVTVSAEQVAGALRSFPTGSAPGPSSLRANHLKEAVFRPSPSHANQSLLLFTKLVNLLVLRMSPKMFHIFAVPLSCHAKKKMGVYAQLLLGRFSAGSHRSVLHGQFCRMLSKSYHHCKWVLASLLVVRPFFTLSQMFMRTPTSPPMIISPSSWTSPMH